MFLKYTKYYPWTIKSLCSKAKGIKVKGTTRRFEA